METKQFKFMTPGVWGGLKAEDAYAELERIREKYGILKPEYVVEESKEEDSLLHKYFQWDDTLAAQSWRKEQARQLIKNITVVVVNENIETSVRAIVSVSNSTEPHRSYIPITEAIKDDVAYQDLLAQAKRDMWAFITKYQQISELNKVKKEMMAALNDILPEEP